MNALVLMGALVCGGQGNKSGLSGFGLDLLTKTQSVRIKIRENAPKSSDEPIKFSQISTCRFLNALNFNRIKTFFEFIKVVNPLAWLGGCAMLNRSLKYYTLRSRKHIIEVKLDSILNRVNHYPSSVYDLKFNLFKLIYSIGVIQSMGIHVSNREKFYDKLGLIEVIKDEPDFKIRISEIQKYKGQEILGRISEDFGVGISVCVADDLYRISWDSLERIIGSGTRPDIRCRSRDDRIIIIEAKGSTQKISKGVHDKAIEQKKKWPGDVHIASLTLLCEDRKSSNESIDPPLEDNDPRLDKRALMASHYAQVFSLLGQSELHRYFSLMKKRLIEGNAHFGEFFEKEEIFQKIKRDYLRIKIRNVEYFGKIERVEEGQFLFTGFDGNLLTYQGFVHFQTYEEPIELDQEENHFVVFQDGVCIGFIENMAPYQEMIGKRVIPHYQESTTISDIDYMDAYAFERYVEYVFKINGFKTKREVMSEKIREELFDLKVKRGGITYFVEIKQYPVEIVRRRRKYPLMQTPGLIKSKEHRMILITNIELPNEEIIRLRKDDVITIDRIRLKGIVKNPSLLEKIIG